MKKVEKQDLIDLHKALSSLNRTRYDSQIKIIEPLESYKEISENAPEIILTKLANFI